ncbi:MAG TPA: hypothetical protein VG474_13570 [Solirubrobacteraceae bacterium]|nr:hypothetical protein [Solirubrobacteraceae bacterium]
MKLRRPSPALVISCIALVVACTGTAFAATIITSSTQIKNGVIRSADIRNGSIQGRDIRNGTITANKLRRGSVPVTGASVGGGANAFHAIRKAGPEGLPPNQMIKVASLTVPAGAYAVTASTVMTALPGPQNPLLPERDSPAGRCRLNLAGDVTESMQNVIVNSKTAPSTLFMQGTRTIGGPSEFFVECGAGSPFRLSETSIIATPVGAIALTTIP